jgi:hypothetical protein
LLSASVAIGLEVLDELFEAEVTDLAGPSGRHDTGRTHNWHGTVDGTVTLGIGGRQVSASPGRGCAPPMTPARRALRPTKAAKHNM